MSKDADPAEATETKTALDRAKERAEKAKEAAAKARKLAEQARNRVAQLEAQKRKPQERSLVRAKIILGGAALVAGKDDPDLLRKICSIMPTAVRVEYEKALARANGPAE